MAVFVGVLDWFMMFLHSGDPISREHPGAPRAAEPKVQRELADQQLAKSE